MRIPSCEAAQEARVDRRLHPEIRFFTELDDQSALDLAVGGQAYRYPNLRPRGLSKPVTLYTAPTSAGVATVACVAPTADCETIANSLKLKSGTAFPVGPSKAYAASLGKILGRLNRTVKSQRPALQSAKTSKAG